MSKSSVVQFALGAVGGYFFGPIGFTIGATLGAALVPPELPDVVGPRLDDLSVSGSGYGYGIPKVYGTSRISTNMIWTSGKKETAHEQEVGGKGTPSQTVTTYTYSIDASFLICEGPISGVRRMWINGKLVYDRSSTGDGETLAAGAGIADAITVYQGDETQTASSLQESYEGVGNVPAYRGTAYIEFDDLQLAEFGNGFVNVEVEVVAATASETQPTQVTPHPIPNDPDYPYLYNTRNGEFKDGVGFRAVAETGDGITEIRVKYQHYSLSDGEILHEQVSTIDSFGPASGKNSFIPVRNMPRTAVIASQFGPVETAYVVNGSRLSKTIENPFGTTTNAFGNPAIAINGYIITSFNPEGLARWAYNQASGIPSGSANLAMSYDDIFAAATGGTGGPVYNLVNDEDGVHFWFFQDTCPVGYSHYLSYMDTDFNILCYWSKNDLGFTFSDSFVVRDGWEPGTEDLKYIMAKSGANVIVYSIDPSTPGSTPTTIGTTASAGASSPLLPIGEGFGISEAAYGLWYIEALLPQAAAGLDDVVSDLCTSVGIAAGDIDVTDLASDTVQGYAIANPTTSRSAIEPLQRAYFFDAALVDGKIVFTKRGGASVKTIADDDLACAQDGEQTPDITQIVRIGDLELPKRIAVSYASQAADYLTVEQHADRLSATGTGLVSTQIPVVLSDNHAAQIAEMLLYSAYAEREKITIYVATKHLEIVPGDVITVASAAHRVRVTDVDIQPMSVIRVDGVIEYADAYTSTATGQAATTVSTAIGNIGPTAFYMIDTSILRDRDDAAGFYAAGRGFLSGWGGAILYKSLDEGASYSDVGSVTAASTMGWSTSVLADGITTTWDMDNTVTINLPNSQSVASASDLSVLNGANVAVIGQPDRWEVIQWGTSTDNGDGTFTLSRLLRGRKGTEHNTANHKAGDAFVVLSETTSARVPITAAEIDAEVFYKGVSIGNLIQNTDPMPYTNTGEALKPYSPVWISGTRGNSPIDLTVTWLRRSRLSYSPLYTIPLGESSESYELEFWNTAESVQYGGTKTATSETYTYTSADQTTDGATPGQAFVVRIYQISAAVGRGHRGSATI